MFGQKETDKNQKQKPSQVSFVWEAESGARKVSVAGDFNGWDPEAGRMAKRSGRFVKKLRLLPGEYQYKFIVDGEWRHDPNADTQVPNEFGSVNSRIRV